MCIPRFPKGESLQTAPIGSVHGTTSFFPLRRWPKSSAASSLTRSGKHSQPVNCGFQDSCKIYPHPGRLLRYSANAAVISGWSTPNDHLAALEHVLQYLGNYTHRIAISNHRLVALADGQVHFRWRDSAHNNKKRVMTLRIEEFLRRFFFACPSQRFCAHPAFWFPGQSPTAAPPGHLSQTAERGRTADNQHCIHRIIHGCRILDLSVLRRHHRRHWAVRPDPVVHAPATSESGGHLNYKSSPNIPLVEAIRDKCIPATRESCRRRSQTGGSIQFRVFQAGLGMISQAGTGVFQYHATPHDPSLALKSHRPAASAANASSFLHDAVSKATRPATLVSLEPFPPGRFRYCTKPYR
jgi:hypothetical protein